MGVLFAAGSHVLHPSHGVCLVRGVEHVAAAGASFDALAIEPLASHSGVVRIPLPKVADAGLRALTPAEAQHENGAFTAPLIDLSAIKMAKVRAARSSAAVARQYRDATHPAYSRAAIGGRTAPPTWPAR